MHRYFIHLSYKGSDFHGWQKQKNAPSVQEEVEKCLNLLFFKGENNVKLIGCGRTDTGVHALNFFAHFDLNKKFKKNELKTIVVKANKILPPSISCHNIFSVAKDLHARYSAIRKTYKYFITDKKIPFFQDYSLYFAKKLNINKMILASQLLKEYKDFSSFVKVGSETKNNLCEVFEADWKYIKSKNMLVFTITANRFLRNMVRAIVGTLLEVGIEKITIDDFKSIIEKKDRSFAGKSALPHGLFLWKVEYNAKIKNLMQNIFF